MKLGIAVVYLVPEENEKLLDLHLSQIEKNTEVPYRIYAAANRLAARFRDKIESRAKVKICELPETELRGSLEHAFYLGRLVDEAIQDGATHVCTLHLDSFPVRPAWTTDLAARLTGDCVLAGLICDVRYDRKPMTAFMMFTREFYLSHRPTFLLTEKVLASPEYRCYSKLWRNIADSGVGYGFKIFSEGLTWIPLTRTDKGPPDVYSFGIFGDVVFHLGGAVRIKQGGMDQFIHFRRLRRLFRAVVPPALWVRLRDQFIQDSIWRMRNRESELTADPDGFLQGLRTGRGRWFRDENHEGPGMLAGRPGMR